ncbi:MAG: ASKHA domain-containing protein [Candidatus Omnitrophota bacterium]
MRKFKIIFRPDNLTVEAEEGKTVLDAAVSAGIDINSSCGGEGTCGKCKVRVLKGAPDILTSGLISPRERKNKVFPACLTVIRGDLEIEVPENSRAAFDAFTAEEPSGIMPETKEGEFKRSPLFASPKGSVFNFGFSFDIGTTTVAGQLTDLNTGKILGTKISGNRQAAFGSDIITRIVYAEKPGGLKKLNRAVLESMGRIIESLAEENKIPLKEIHGILCSGNTTMIHLLLKIDPAWIRRQPQLSVPSFPTLTAKKAGIKINPAGILKCIPGVSGYIGGDTVSGVLAAGFYREEPLCMLIDIGTNGEIVLGSREYLAACAASAGPAFEGSGLSCGMRAVSGAIQKVEIDSKTFKSAYLTVSGDPARGICGSGYIDLLSEMLQRGIIDKNGKISAEGKHIRSTDNGKEFIVVSGEETRAGQDIVVSETDIENLKRSKGAVYSACAVLARHLSLDLSAVSRIFISGGFGSRLDIEKAVRIGLLPDLPREKFIFLGNSSLSGCRKILLSQDALKEAFSIASRITYFDLASDPGYMEEYGRALFFPHTDLDKFPTVKF